MIVAILTNERVGELWGCITWRTFSGRTVNQKNYHAISEFLSDEFPAALPLLSGCLHARVEYKEGKQPYDRVFPWGLYVGPGKPPETIGVALYELGEATWMVKKRILADFSAWEGAVSDICQEARVNDSAILPLMRTGKWPRRVVITGISQTAKIEALPMLRLPQSDKYLTLQDWAEWVRTGWGGKKVLF